MAPKITYGIGEYKAPKTEPDTHTTYPTILNPHHKGKGKMADALTHDSLYNLCVVQAEMLQTQITTLEARVAELEKINNFKYTIHYTDGSEK